MCGVYLKNPRPGSSHPFSWLKLKRRILGLHGVPRGDTPPLWDQRWDFPRQNWLPDVPLRICKAEKPLETLVAWSCALLLLQPLYRAQEPLQEELWLLFPKRRGVGIAHTQRTEGGMTRGQPGQNCPWTWLGVRLESDIPVLYFALLQPFLGTRATREITWRSWLSRGATRLNAQNSQRLSKGTVQSII